MELYQTACYKARYISDDLGWDISGKAIFESTISEDAGLCMQQFDFYEPTHANWIAVMRVIRDGKLVEEERFDSSVYDMENM